jgi:hypothetical protein
MLGQETYKAWTAVFSEGSYYAGSWNEGEQIRFLSQDGSGMLSVIAENRPYEFVSIKHLGMIYNGVEDTESGEVRRWAPIFENYTFTSVGASTEVRVDVDVHPDFEDYMLDNWPKALVTLKQICEAA